jgi:hypothetical protein
MQRRSFLRLALAAPLLTGCSVFDPGEGAADGEGEIVSGTGTVRRFDLEGGFFAIAGDDGVTYDPTNLAEEFQRDGLRVRFRARVRDDMAGIHMVGPIVEILEISRL